MSKIVFAVLPEKGHINPYIGPAQALRDRGHQVVFVAPKDISEQILRSGLKFDPVLVNEVEPSLPMRGEALVNLIQNKALMHEWVSELLLSTSTEDVEKLKSFFVLNEVSCVVVDPLYSVPVLAAEAAGIKWVSMSNSLNPALNSEVTSDLLETVELIKRKREALFEKFDLRVQFSGCDILSKHLTIAFATKEFVGDPPRDVALVGPSLPVNERGDEVESEIKIDDRPLVYASFGSQIYHWPKIFENLIEACSDLDVRLALSMGELAKEFSARKLPEFVQIFEYAPQLEILKRAKVFITHGGANSVMEALATGTPLLISPMCNDQFHQAYFVKRSGVGLVTNLQVEMPQQTKNKIETLLSSDQIRAAMDRVSHSYRRNGSVESANLIESLL